MAQQTAVEWLIKKLDNREKGVFDGLPHLSVDKIYEQAKKMGKEQIMEAWIEGGGYSRLSEESDRMLAEQYYKETYENQ